VKQSSIGRYNFSPLSNRYPPDFKTNHDCRNQRDNTSIWQVSSPKAGWERVLCKSPASQIKASFLLRTANVNYITRPPENFCNLWKDWEMVVDKRQPYVNSLGNFVVGNFTLHIFFSLLIGGLYSPSPIRR
jgi:hypothetical protein